LNLIDTFHVAMRLCTICLAPLQKRLPLRLQEVQQQSWTSNRSRQKSQDGGLRTSQRPARIQDMLQYNCHERGLIETSMQAQNHSQHQREQQVTPAFLILHPPTTSQQGAQANPVPRIHLRPPQPSQHQSHTPTVLPTVHPALTQPIPSPPLLPPTPPPPSHLQRIPSHRASHPTLPTSPPPHQLHTHRPPLSLIGHEVRLRL